MKIKSQLIDAQLEQRGSSPTKKSEIVYNTGTNEVEYFDNSNAKALVTKTGTQTLTNKTLTSPTIGTGASFANQASADFYEQSGNGTNKISVKAPASLAGDLTFTLPDSAPNSGDFLQASSSTATQWVAQTTLSLPTGVVFPYLASTAPSGYVLASGKTIGNGSSGGTERANSDTENLFTLLWNSFANTELAIQDSSGSASTRGANAAADFAANKRLPVPDGRGRTFIGKDDLGGSAASRVTTGGSGLDGATLGKAGGAQTHTLTTAQMPSHTHVQDAHNHTQASHSHTITQSSVAASGTTSLEGNNSSGGTQTTSSATPTINSTTATNQNTGGDGAHNNMQPSIVVGYIIKL